MEKNVIVVDEAGNEYEATYPKRAKGLVKNGRARFIDEKTICLACPPKKSMEDKKMSENKEIKSETKNSRVASEVQQTAENRPLTAREIFEKIAELQEQLTKNSYHSLHRLDDSVASICGAEENEGKNEQVSEVCGVFKMREDTLANMLSLYEKMYNDLNSEYSQKIGLVKVAFDRQAELISKTELKPEDKFAALSEVTEKIAELTEKILIPTTQITAKENVARELVRLLRVKDCPKDSAVYASEALGEFLGDSDSI
ncbi:MAG: hypothetical protein IJN17_04665 [Clostridia bacterium]|nr:hypothetical protein [Clostridia bacterium]